MITFWSDGKAVSKVNHFPIIHPSSTPVLAKTCTKITITFIWNKLVYSFLSFHIYAFSFQIWSYLAFANRKIYKIAAPTPIEIPCFRKSTTRA